jgi:hypothetical protein
VTYRIIPSKFPPINFFENLADPDLMDEIYIVESITNDRLRNQVGDISLVPKEDRVSGPGSSIVMASFTHSSLDRPSRFSNGEYGVYYASREIDTAIEETAYQREKFLNFTKEPSGKITMRMYQSKNITKPLKDLRGNLYPSLMNPDSYIASQQVGRQLKDLNSWGLVYDSIRQKGGQCVAILRPAAVPLPVTQTKHFEYIWDGQRISAYYEISGELHNR